MNKISLKLFLAIPTVVAVLVSLPWVAAGILGAEGAWEIARDIATVGGVLTMLALMGIDKYLSRSR